MPHFGGVLRYDPVFFGIQVSLDHLRMTPTATKCSGSRSNGTERLPRLFPSRVANQTRVRRPRKPWQQKPASQVAGRVRTFQVRWSVSRLTSDVFASLILGVTVPLLQPTFELVALAVDGGQIIVCLTSFQFPSTRFQSMAISSGLRECANA